MRCETLELLDLLRWVDGGVEALAEDLRTARPLLLRREQNIRVPIPLLKINIYIKEKVFKNGRPFTPTPHLPL